MPEPDPQVECPRCHGAGEITSNPSPLRDPQCETSERCGICRGSGVVPVCGVCEQAGAEHFDEYGLGRAPMCDSCAETAWQNQQEARYA